VSCPECGDQKFQDICPQCEARTGSAESSVQFGFHSQHSSAEASKRQSWHLELKRRLDEHYEKQQKSSEEIQKKPQPNSLAQQSLGSSAERSLFDYSLEKASSKTSHRGKVRSVKQSGAAAVVTEKPLIRTPSKPRRNLQGRSPLQRRLVLHGAMVGAENPVANQEEKVAVRPEMVSREIIFSRILAGIVDLSLPFFLATLFVLTASMILNFDLFSPDSIKIGSAFSLCFYFLNSFFFLALSRQTPGMYLTDLQLVGEKSEDFTIQSLFLRVALFLPVSFTVVGLIWGIFDPWCRCFHDRISRTRVVPVED
jgi:uncharacterized Zn finger protein (UPF0148 family)